MGARRSGPGAGRAGAGAGRVRAVGMMMSNKLDEVSRNSIWREHCTKEQAGRKLNTTFAITNPLKMPTLPDKPNYVNPISTNKEELLAAAEQLRTICSIKTADQIPPEKYDLPQTSSQEYGWVHKVRAGASRAGRPSSGGAAADGRGRRDRRGARGVKGGGVADPPAAWPTLNPAAPLCAPQPLVKVEDEFMSHNSRSSCEITRYADAYYTMAGTTPFSRRET